MKPDVTANASISKTHPQAVSRLKRRWTRLIGLLLAFVVVVVLVTGIVVAWINTRLDEARQLATRGRWEDAAESVSRYLWLWPHDAEARLLAAEYLYRAGNETGRKNAAVRESLRHLELIPDDSRQGSEARLRAAGMLLTILKKPHAAELQLRRAIARDPDWIQAHHLLWQILDVTGRSDYAEPTARAVIRLAPPEQKVVHLRSWYLSQFAPAAANLQLDRLLGVVDVDEVPDTATELARYELFRVTEPQSPIHAAALARVFLRQDQAPQALALLDEFVPPAGSNDSFFAMVRAEVAHAAGDMVAFESAMQNWSGPRDGYDYLKWEGVRLEEIADDPTAAAAAYQKALKTWPGPVDWQVVFRLSNCERRLGRPDAADRLKARSDELGRLIGDEFHRPLREALADLADPKVADQVADFYQTIDRPWESGLWRAHAAQLRQSPPTIPSQPAAPFGGPTDSTTQSLPRQ